MQARACESTLVDYACASVHSLHIPQQFSSCECFHSVRTLHQLSLCSSRVLENVGRFENVRPFTICTALVPLLGLQSSPEQLEATERNPEQPRTGQTRATKSSPEQLRAAQSSTKQPRAAQTTQRMTSSEKPTKQLRAAQPRAAKNNTEQPRASQSSSERLKIAP